MQTGDLVILIAYGQMEDAEARELEPHVVFVDSENHIIGTGTARPKRCRTRAWCAATYGTDMSLLAMDISNSHTTLGIFKDEELTAHWTVASDTRRTSDEWYLVLQGLVTRRRSPK